MFWIKIYEFKLICQPQINVFELQNVASSFAQHNTGWVCVFDRNSTLVFENAAYLSIFDNLEEVRKGIAYFQLLKLLA